MEIYLPTDANRPNSADQLYDIPAFGNVSLLHFTECHAQLLPACLLRVVDFQSRHSLGSTTPFSLKVCLKSMVEQVEAVLLDRGFQIIECLIDGFLCFLDVERGVLLK